MELRYDMLVMGVYIVAAQHQGKRGGLALAWATQVAKDRFLICVGSQSATRDLILASQAFGLSVLGQDQIALARAFGERSSRDVDKFAVVPFHTAVTGSPLLDNCVAAYDCRLEDVLDHDSHKLIIGCVVAAERIGDDAQRLIYRQEDYGH